MSRRRKSRYLFLAFTYAFLAIFLIWKFFPSSDDFHRIKIEGIPEKFTTGGKSSRKTFRIGDLIFSCSASPLKHSYTCPTNFSLNVTAEATYFLMPTILTSLLGEQDVPILTRLEQNGKVLMAYNTLDIIESYEYGSFFMALFLFFLFWMASGLNFFTKEN